MSVMVFMDCGAPTLHNKLTRFADIGLMGINIKHRWRDTFDWTDLPEFKAYRRKFARFIKANSDVIDEYANLDIIGNAEKTWENQQWMEARGLTPLPVWHLGTDIKWLEMYLEKGYKHICFGGMSPNTIHLLKPALDYLWSKYLTDKDGMPLVKVHGFAMTAFHLMLRYPWYSVDSKTWSDHARFGQVLVARKDVRGEYVYRKPVVVTVSGRIGSKSGTKTSAHSGLPKKHLNVMPIPDQKAVLEYLEMLGIGLGNSTFREEPLGYKPKPNQELWARPATKEQSGMVEIIVERGVTNCYAARMGVNIHFFTEIERTAPAWPWSIFDTIGRQAQERVSLL